MANLKDIQSKINSVSGTQKTTRAMKLVSAAKLRKTEELAKRSKIYATKLSKLLADIAVNIQYYKIGGLNNHRSFTRNDLPKMVDIIFITADRGLCGGFNIQTIKIIKKILKEFKANKVKVRLKGIGKKGIEYFTYNGVELVSEEIGLSSSPDYKRSAAFIQSSVDDFANSKTDRVMLIHNGFINVITQELKVEQLLPIDVSGLDHTKNSGLSLLEIEAEDETKMLERLVLRYLEYSIYYALIDSLAAEHSSRMQAMDAATTNAKELVKDLNVKYNKVRQESITTELIEIISGVESMK